MKTLKHIFSFCLVALLFLGCEQDDNADFVKNITAPTNVSASVNIVPDNSGLTKITPLGEGVASYIVDYGDGSDVSESLAPGDSAEHVYEEGTYEAIIKAYSINGLETTASQTVVVSFRAPENIAINAVIDGSNAFILNVSATADFASGFLVYFDTSNVDEEGTLLGLDETVSFEYPAVGDYTIKVVALSGGTETSELTEVVTIAKPTALPIDFEIFDTSVFIGFGGASNAIVDNPDTNGNTSAKVGQIIKNAPEVWAGNVITTSAPIDLSFKKLIKMKVWSPRPGGELTLKLENISDDQVFSEKVVTTVGNSAWEEVTFDFSDIDDSQTYQKLVVFFDFGEVGDGSADWTFYIDDLKQASSEVGSSVFSLDFEPPFELSSFDGGEIAIVANPDANGNTSATVSQLIKGSGQVWAGSKITTNTPFQIEENITITAKVWSPRVGLELLMKFEDATPWPDTVETNEITATTTVANAWEEISFTITGVDANVDYYGMVLIMDNGTNGDGSADYTIYLDDLSVTSFLDFEEQEQLSSFDGGEIAIVANPDTNGNSSNMVVELVKGAGQVWAGSKIMANTPFQLEENVTITAKIWSPRVGLEILMKFEDTTPWPDTIETDESTATTTVENAWEEVSFTITGVDANVDYYNMVLIMDNGTNGDGSADYTIYMDDISNN